MGLFTHALLCKSWNPGADHLSYVCYLARVGASNAYSAVSEILFTFKEVCDAYEMIHRVLDAESLCVNGDTLECAHGVRRRGYWRLWILSSTCDPTDRGTIAID